MKKKILVYVFLFLLVLSSSVFATDSLVTTTSLEPKVISEDLFTVEDSYVLDGEVDGNVFNYSGNFEMLSTSIINGDLFLSAKTVTLESDVSYSDLVSKDGDSAIDKINSYASINGNAVIVCNELTIESGVEISGDLYVIAKKVNIQKSSVIQGNLFATCEDLTLNGKVESSVYAAANNFSMNYYGSIYKDLKLVAQNINLSSVIRRNVNISTEKIVTDSNFLTYGNFTLTANSFDFSGEIDGDAKINSKNLNFIDGDDDTSFTCLIMGNLDYSSSEELKLTSTVVEGTVNYSKYEEKTTNKFSFKFKSFIFSLLTFVAYIFVSAWLFTLINKNCLSKNYDIKVGKTFAAFGIGLLAFLVVIILSILLLVINIGSTLSFFLVFAYIFLLFLAMPLFVLDIANLLKGKMDLYLGILAIAFILALISKIPFLGEFVIFVFITIGAGRIIMHLFSK